MVWSCNWVFRARGGGEEGGRRNGREGKGREEAKGRMLTWRLDVRCWMDVNAVFIICCLFAFVFPVIHLFPFIRIVVAYRLYMFTFLSLNIITCFR